MRRIFLPLLPVLRPIGSEGGRARELPPAQQRVVEAIRTSPGLPLQRLARLLDIATATANYHADRLEQCGEIRSVRVGRRRLLFLHEENEPEDADVLAAMQHPATRTVARAVLRLPHCSARDIHEATGLTHRIVYHQLKILRRLGLVTAPDAGVYRRLVASDRLAHALERIERRGQDASDSSLSSSR